MRVTGLTSPRVNGGEEKHSKHLFLAAYYHKYSMCKMFAQQKGDRMIGVVWPCNSVRNFCAAEVWA